MLLDNYNIYRVGDCFENIEMYSIKYFICI